MPTQLIHYCAKFERMRWPNTGEKRKFQTPAHFNKVNKDSMRQQRAFPLLGPLSQPAADEKSWLKLANSMFEFCARSDKHADRTIARLACPRHRPPPPFLEPDPEQKWPRQALFLLDSDSTTSSADGTHTDTIYFDVSGSPLRIRCLRAAGSVPRAARRRGARDRGGQLLNPRRDSQRVQSPQSCTVISAHATFLLCICVSRAERLIAWCAAVRLHRRRLSTHAQGLCIWKRSQVCPENGACRHSRQRVSVQIWEAYVSISKL